MTVLPFIPKSIEEVELERLLEAFPADKFEGRLHQDAAPYISPAQVKTALRCLETYRRRYVRGEKTRPAAALTWGTADHKAHEVNFGQKMTSGVDMPVPEIQDLFASALDEQVEKDGGVSEVEWEKDVILTGGDALKAFATVKDNGVDLVGLYATEISPRVRPTAVELLFEQQVPGIPVPIRGAIDLIAEVADTPATDEQVTWHEQIIDRKTAGRRTVSPEWITQARIYQLYKPLPLDFHLSLKKGKQRKSSGVAAGEFVIAPPPQQQTVALVQRVVALVTSCYETYGPDEPWPGTALGGFGDNCGFCGFKPTCPWWVWNG